MPDHVHKKNNNIIKKLNVSPFQTSNMFSTFDFECQLIDIRMKRQAICFLSINCTCHIDFRIGNAQLLP